MTSFRPACAPVARRIGLLALALLLGACSSTSRRPDPAPLPPDPHRVSVRQIWSVETGTVTFPLVVQVAGDAIAMASDAGQISLIDARTGEVRWRVELRASLTAGAGHDGQTVAVITADNEVVALEDGRELWRERLNTSSYTPPLVAGGRVFVLGADRSVFAFDGRSGRRIWTQTRTGEALVLRQSGLMGAVGDTLLVGLSGRLVGMNPLTGASRWEVPISTPRGTNDVERLVDLVAGVARNEASVCVRAFQAAVGCVDAGGGKLQWTKNAFGASGLSGDRDMVFGVEFDGVLTAWRRSDGERVWSMNQLRYRRLSAPLLLGSLVVLGDSEGRLHFYARDNGALQGRVETRPQTPAYVSSEAGLTVGDAAFDVAGDAIVIAPVLAGNTLVVVTQGGRVLGLRPE